MKSQLRQAVIDLDHIDASLKLFDPDAQISELGPRKVPQVLTHIHGDTGRVILDTLREATAPITTAGHAVMKARGPGHGR